MQGDIVKIIDRSGAEAASYKYDSWGKITAESGDSVIRELNPFRYRGYVYDTETGLYYLQSRYYDPITGRFLNADIYCDTQSGSPLSTNMFAYCENNSITYNDISGKKSNKLILPPNPLQKTKKAHRAFWLTVVSALKVKKWNYSADFLRHSLSDKPSNVLFNSKSKISKTIANTKQYKDMISSLRKNYKNKWVNKYKKTLEFSSGDLLGALHYVDITINEIYINGVRYFQSNISDKYDFKREDYSGNWPIKVGNNLAVSSQSIGAIVPYKIYIIIINTKR